MSHCQTGQNGLCGHLVGIVVVNISHQDGGDVEERIARESIFNENLVIPKLVKKEYIIILTPNVIISQLH